MIAVSISACFDLTAALCVATALGTASSVSAFLTIYQSVLLNSDCACNLTFLINCVLRPSTLTVLVVAPSGASPASISDCVHLVSACALAVASP